MVVNMVPNLPYFENRGDFRSLCMYGLHQSSKEKIIVEASILYFWRDLTSLCT